MTSNYLIIRYFIFCVLMKSKGNGRRLNLTKCLLAMKESMGICFLNFSTYVNAQEAWKAICNHSFKMERLGIHRQDG